MGRMGRVATGRSRVVTARVLIALIGVVAAAALVAACTSDEDSADGAGGSSTPTGEAADVGSTSTAPRECESPASDPVMATAVANSTSDYELTSFDGTTIRVHWFPVESADGPLPTVLMGPGWGSAGDTNVDTVGVLGAINIKTLRDAGYNVLTWDPRGFGRSTGTARVDSVEFEARDVQRLIDWVSARPEAAMDRPADPADPAEGAVEPAGDPAIGMVGGSYGGGIQLVTAAIDCRVDAIVPIIAWHSLGTSLYKDGTFKQGWANILAKVAATARLDPMITESYAQASSTGSLTDAQRDWFLARGPGDLVSDITAPTMVVGGTIDTLFTLDEDVTNYRMIGESGVPVSMYWYCGGHGTCLTETGDEQRMADRVVSWLDRYVKGDESVDTGAGFDFLDQDGVRYTADSYPMAAGVPISASGSGTIELSLEGGSGPASVPSGKADILSGVAGSIIPAPAANAVRIAIPVDSAAMVVGAPELRMTYSGAEPTGAGGTAGRPTRVFAQLVDTASGLVVGNQITPVPLTLDGRTHSVEVPLEIVAQRVDPDSSLELQLVATTTLYGLPRLGGSVELSDVSVHLPTVTGYQKVG